MSESLFRKGEWVIWLESRTWGGKQNTHAEFIRYVGGKSARIKAYGKERTVRTVWLRASENQPQTETR